MKCKTYAFEVLGIFLWSMSFGYLVIFCAGEVSWASVQKVFVCSQPWVALKSAPRHCLQLPRGSVLYWPCDSAFTGGLFGFSVSLCTESSQ